MNRVNALKVFVFILIFAGIVYDALFSMIPGMGAHGYVGTISAIILCLIILGVRKIMR